MNAAALSHIGILDIAAPLLERLNTGKGISSGLLPQIVLCLHSFKEFHTNNRNNWWWIVDEVAEIRAATVAAGHEIIRQCQTVAELEVAISPTALDSCLHKTNDVTAFVFNKSEVY